MNRFLLHGLLVLLLLIVILSLCCTKQKEEVAIPVIHIEAESFIESSGEFQVVQLEDGNKVVVNLNKGDWLGFEVNVSTPGRYRCEIKLSSKSNFPGSCWIEDYYDNTDSRTYDITAAIPIPATRKGGIYSVVSKDGSPLNTGLHKMKFHAESDSINIDWIKFTLIKNHQFTSDTLVQNMNGTDWKLVWSDEFEGSGLVDSTKWTYDIGNWGWGNNEPQYYTEKRVENARQEGGNLIIEARKNDLGYPWTSARLTTRGKVSFIYGKIEFRAKVPAGDGAWAACWTLGDAYRDELSWPYCGEIDILEIVGREIDDETGDGINHASCHTRAYYFKQGNHLTNTIPVKNMTNEYHLYSAIWDKDAIEIYLDGEKYYTYDKKESQWAWPYNEPQNLIINLAIGGNMGGYIDESLTSSQMVIDYVRVYEKR